MKVAICTHLSMAYGGGGEKWAWMVARYMRDHGHQVQVHSLPYAPGGRRMVNPSQVLDGIPYCEKWIHDIDDVDVVYVFYNPGAHHLFRTSSPRIAGFLSGVYFMSGEIDRNYGWPAILAASLFRAIGQHDLKGYASVHLPNPSTRVPHPHLEYVPNFIDTRVYTPQGEKNPKFTVLFVGRPSWQKGWPTVLELARELGGMEDLEFAWAGGAEAPAGVPLRPLGFIGSPSLMAKIYSSGHLVVAPSKAETFPLSMLESLASGTRVLSTPIPSVKALGLPILYAQDLPEIKARVLEQYERWKRDPQEFMDARPVLRESVLKYDVTRVLPELEAMMIRAAMRGT